VIGSVDLSETSVIGLLDRCALTESREHGVRRIEVEADRYLSPVGCVST